MGRKQKAVIFMEDRSRTPSKYLSQYILHSLSLSLCQLFHGILVLYCYAGDFYTLFICFSSYGFVSFYNDVDVQKIVEVSNLVAKSLN